MGDSLRRDELIEEWLNESDLDLDPFADDEGDDGNYVPDELNFLSERHSSGSSSSSDDEVNATPLLTERGSRGRRRGGRQGRLGRSRGRHDGSNGVVSTSTPVSPWVETVEFIPNVTPFIEPTYLPVNTEDFQKYDYFKQYIDYDILNLIVEKTNQMSIFKTGRSVNLTLAELNTFIGVMMVMSTINYLSLKMYWQRKYRVDIIVENMSRNRFFLLKNSLKMVFDPTISAEEKIKDKLWKVRPLLNRVVSGCRKQKREKVLCIDEMIIPFTGKCGVKQYCPNKPNPTGLKAFVLADPKGIICDLHVYQGATTYPEYDNMNFGLGEKVVLRLSADLLPGHIIYFDRYFTTEKLALELKNQGIMCAGTIAKNRIPKLAKPLIKSESQLKRTGRGSSQVIVNENSNLAITTWLDNKPVSLMSTIHANTISDQCQRWCKKEKRYVTVNRPEVIKAYNCNMGGVDLTDRLLAVCPFRYRTRKWTQRFFAHMIDLSVSNAWLQYRSDQVAKNVDLKKVQQLRSFKLELGELMIEAAADTDNARTSESESERSTSKKRGRNFTVPIPSNTKRKRGAVHMPALSQNQNVCRRRDCNKKTKMFCSGCRIHLCVTYERNCFAQFHS